MMTTNIYPKITAATLLFLCVNICYAQKNNSKIYHKDWIDFNKNGKKDVYEDSKQPIDKRVDNLVSLMSVEEKTNQTATLYGYGRVLKDEMPTPDWKNSIWKDGIANIDESLNSLPNNLKAVTEYSFPYSKHATAINTLQKWFIEDTRLGIPVDFTNEGIHGLCHDRATPFCAPIGIGSTWNKALVRKGGEIVGREAKALGYTNVYAPILDLARDPRWGRVVECYGEDPFLVGELGKNVVSGIQSNGVASTLKHYAVYSVPKGGRDGNARTDPHVSPRELHQIHLYPFKKVIKEAKPMGIMSSYNDWDGIPVSASSYFLIDLLRKEYGFDGYVVSDSEAVEFIASKHRVAKDFKEASVQALNAGLNVWTNFRQPENYINNLRASVKDGSMKMDVLDQRVKEVLTVKFRLGLFDNPYTKDPKASDAQVQTADDKKFAEQMNRESIVLLKNQNSFLPLDKNKNQKILVTGPMAAEIGYTVSRYGPSNNQSISILEGLKQYNNQKLNIDYAKGCDVVNEGWPLTEIIDNGISDKDQAMIDEAVAKANQSDMIIAVVGEDEKTVGESLSRTSLNLPGRQLELLKALHKTGKPVVMVLVNGRPLTINWENQYLTSILETWFLGPSAGRVVAETLFGDYNPGGKLPVTFPKSIGQIEYNFPFKPGSHGNQPRSGDNGYGRSRVQGALYPFGYGLSYTTFSYQDLKIDQSQKGSIAVTFKLTNTGKREGDEVVQLYFKDLISSVITYDTQLRAFERVHLKAGESKNVNLKFSRQDLEFLDKDMKWIAEAGDYEIYIGSSSEDIRLKGEFTL
jgi:beta-glucosidase